ncbi:hypothetical protein BLNAU_3864 [Blattamonas nauphoetae]|uniref:Protein kinase domain-containing protein n=1 Tax=Blattamonas nauphoetae TaxID=2049346 RepID=A0ABQ9YBE2_9EUKA|nr:hypothetical protein BLNAU_3864 [Blattamonas nauphoetae]
MGGTLTLSGTVFDFTVRFSSSSALLTQTGGNLDLDTVTIGNVSRTVGGGSVIYSSLSSSEGRMEISGCSFEFVSSSGDGGAILAELGEGSTLTVTDTTFTSCSSSGKGGALSIVLSSTGSFALQTGTSFESCSAASGSAVFVQASSLASAITESSMAFLAPFPLTPTPALLDLYRGWNTASTSDAVPLVLFLAEVGSTGFASSSGSDGELCGFSVYPCSSLSTVQTRLAANGSKTEGKLNPITIQLQTALEQKTSFSCGAHAATITGNTITLSSTGQFTTSSASSSLTLSTLTFLFTSSQSQPAISVAKGEIVVSGCTVGNGVDEIPVTFGSVSGGSLELSGTNMMKSVSTSSPLFVVASGTLKIESGTSLTHSATTRIASLFDLSGGSTTIASLVIPSFTLDSTISVFSLTNTASLSLSSTSFSSISTTSSVTNTDSGAVGSIITANILPTARLTLSTCTFTSCQSSSAAAALLITIVSSPTSNIDQSPVFSLNDCYFANNTHKTSNDVMIITQPPNNEAISIVNTFSDSDMDHLLVNSVATNNLIPFSILFVTREGFDDQNCKLPDVPCSSVEKSLEHCINLEKNNTHALRIIEMEEGTFSVGRWDFGKKNVLVQGESNKNVVMSVQSLTESFVSIEEGIVTLKRFTIDASSSSPDHVLLSVHDGNLDLQFIEIDWASTQIEASPIVVDGGVLSLQQSTFSDVTLSEVTLIDTASLFTTSQCVFSSISRTNESHPIVVCQLSPEHSVSMESTTFQDNQKNKLNRCVLLFGLNDQTFLRSHWEGTFSLGDAPSVVQVVSATADWKDTSFNPYSLLYHFYPRTASITVQNSSLAADHPLCGSTSLPCSTIDQGVLLTAAEVVEIVDEGRLNDVVNLNGENLTVKVHKGFGIIRATGKGSFVNNEFVEPDILTISTLTLDVSGSELDSSESFIRIECGQGLIQTCSVVSAKPIPFTLVSVLKGSMELNKFTVTDLSFTNPGQTAIHVANADNFTLQECFFTNTLSSSNENEADTENICDWTTSLVHIDNSTAHIHFTSISGFSQGALFVSNSTTTIRSSEFSDNSLKHDVYPSFRRNIRCEGGTLNVATLSSGDGHKEGSSAWISKDEDCQFISPVVSQDAPLFIPILLTDSKVELDKSKNFYKLALKGTLFIPCGLSVEVFENISTSKTTFSEGLGKQLEISDLTPTDWTETGLNIIIPHSSLSSTLNNTHEWRIRLIFGNGLSTASFRLKMSLSDDRKAQAKQAMKWLLPVIISAVALLFILIVVILLCRRHRKKKAEKATGSLLQQQELDIQQIVEKDDEFSIPHASLGTTAFVFQDGPESKGNKEQGKNLFVGDELTQYAQDMIPPPPLPSVEVVNCDDQHEVKMIAHYDSLYKRLHSQKPIGLDRHKLKIRVVEALKHIAETDADAQILVRFSPHWVLLNHNDEIFLRTRADTTTLNPTNTATNLNTQSQTVQHEDQRWCAPETTAMKSKQIDTAAAAVFSLGLVLAEIDTGQVPFGETDALNANRMLGTGFLPKTDGMSETAVSLLKRCVAVNPIDRPSFDEVLSSVLAEEGQEPPKPMGNMPIQGQNEAGDV